jgi:hypothetical protein
MPPQDLRKSGNPARNHSIPQNHMNAPQSLPPAAGEAAHTLPARTPDELAAEIALNNRAVYIKDDRKFAPSLPAKMKFIGISLCASDESVCLGEFRNARKTDYRPALLHVCNSHGPLVAMLEELFDSYAGIEGNATPQEKILFDKTRRVLRDAKEGA